MFKSWSAKPKGEPASLGSADSEGSQTDSPSGFGRLNLEGQSTINRAANAVYRWAVSPRPTASAGALRLPTSPTSRLPRVIAV